MERKIYAKLKEWKESKDRKPLILQGPRQTGKTYILNTFGEKEYDNVVYCNFEQEERLGEFFESDLNPHNIIEKIGYEKRKEIMPGKTLIIFDEIQVCPKAVTSLKYFCEEANDYHVIASGSLLGLAVYRKEFSFPVGKVQFLNMYPMDFEEYLLANKEEFLIRQIRNAYQNDKPLESVFHERALRFFKSYLYIGGMPEVVSIFLTYDNESFVRDKQQFILDAYLNDMSKYNSPSQVPKTRLIYKSIPSQLAQENRKFKYSSVKSGGRAREFEESLEWVSSAGIAYQLYKLKQIKLPLEAYKSLDDFKFYMSDIGLCSASQKLLLDDLVHDNPLINDFKGGLIENYVHNQLKCNGLDLYYWTSENQAEVDFVTRINGDIVPIEVKSSDNVRSRSLSIFVDKFKPKYSIRLSTKNFGFDNGIKSVPLYAAFCIK